MKNINSFGNILFDQGHNQAWCSNSEEAKSINKTHYKDSSYQKALDFIKKLGFNVEVSYSKFDNIDLFRYDLIIITHFSNPLYEITNKTGDHRLSENEINSLKDYIKKGGSLFILAEHEHLKYQNNLNEFLINFDIEINHTTITDTSLNYNNVASWIIPQILPSNLTFNTKNIVMYRAGSFTINNYEYIKPILLSQSSSSEIDANLAVFYNNIGKIFAIADSDIFGDDSIEDGDHYNFLKNIIYTLICKDKDNLYLPFIKVDDNLYEKVSKLRFMQNSDGSIDIDKFNIKEIDLLIDDIILLYSNEIVNFPHNKDFMLATIDDLNSWKKNNYKVPNFYNSLLKFYPHEFRKDNIEHLVILPFYTQNGKSDKTFEYLHFRVFWPDWIDHLENKFYSNPAFIPTGFIKHTEGYNTNSAVFFPETVTSSPSFFYKWGAIFADREAARFTKITTDAIKLLNINTPPELLFLLKNPKIVLETFILWDLVHDRQHSLGELPFDPFMIKQRAPFWMYSLEEMRCDLSAYLEMSKLNTLGISHFQFVKYAVILDRVIRFPITNDRNRNYDGLVGQVLFSQLHRDKALIWKDNNLYIDYDKIDKSIENLFFKINELYKNAINSSKINFWLDAYKFFIDLVPATHLSKIKNIDDLDLNNSDLLSLINPDEFPLSVFYESLKKKLSKSLEDAKGIHL